MGGIAPPSKKSSKKYTTDIAGFVFTLSPDLTGERAKELAGIKVSVVHTNRAYYLFRTLLCSNPSALKWKIVRTPQLITQMRIEELKLASQ